MPDRQSGLDNNTEKAVRKRGRSLEVIIRNALEFAVARREKYFYAANQQHVLFQFQRSQHRAHSVIAIATKLYFSYTLLLYLSLSGISRKQTNKGQINEA